MHAGHRKNVIVIVILFIVSFFVLRIERAGGTVASDIDLKKIPLTVSEWQGKDLPLKDMVYEILETQEVLARQYEDRQGNIVYLSVTYAGENRHNFHPPEVCYLGGGYIELLEKKQERIALSDTVLDVSRLTMRSSEGLINAWYWFLAGNRFVPTYYLQQAYLCLDALRGKKVRGALVRISIHSDVPVHKEKARSFIKETVPYLREIL